MFPLIFSGMLEKVDVETNVEGGGEMGQAGAIRWGISMALRSFVDTDTLDRMRLGELFPLSFLSHNSILTFLFSQLVSCREITVDLRERSLVRKVPAANLHGRNDNSSNCRTFLIEIKS